MPVIALIFIIALFLIGPAALIAALGVIFPTAGIVLTVKTWFAGLVVLFLLRGN